MEKKQIKLLLTIYFLSITLAFEHEYNKLRWLTFVGTMLSKSGIFYIYITSQFGLATFQVLTIYMWVSSPDGIAQARN